MTHEFQIAFIRGVITAIITAGSAFFTALAADVSAEKAGITAGAAAFAVLVARFGAEGGYDSSRNANGPLHDPDHL